MDSLATARGSGVIGDIPVLEETHVVAGDTVDAIGSAKGDGVPPGCLAETKVDPGVDLDRLPLVTVLLR